MNIKYVVSFVSALGILVLFSTYLISAETFDSVFEGDTDRSEEDVEERVEYLQGNGLSEQKTVKFNSRINTEYMSELEGNLVEESKNKLDASHKELDNTMLQLTLKLKEDEKKSEESDYQAIYESEFNGVFKMPGQRAFPFEGEGDFEYVENEETGDSFYYGHVSSQLNEANLSDEEQEQHSLAGFNSGFIIVFDANNPNDYYIASTIGFEERSGTQIFGDSSIYQEWENAVVSSGGEMNWN
ncbi:hypothetical protein [Alkalicoccus chagannorensis]|uniref:hypothetical protein n=1 Tax=Alkalicoccus chagannorensis TaxID=427072 RepID=UPI00047CD245|nr:hypothetical protein [Alkalicoccus chagannorensis]